MLSLLELIKSMPLLFKHLDFRKDEINVKAVVGAFLKLMEDPDKDVRVAFSGHVRYLLGSLDFEEGLVKEVSCLSTLTK